VNPNFFPKFEFSRLNSKKLPKFEFSWLNSNFLNLSFFQKFEFTLSSALKFWPKFFWKWSFFDQKQQLLNNHVESCERILRALLIAQCPYKFSSLLDLRNHSSRFRLFARDFRLFRLFFSRSACFSKVALPENLQSWVKYYGKSESFWREFRWTKFNAVERVSRLNSNNFQNLSSAGWTQIFAELKGKECWTREKWKKQCFCWTIRMDSGVQKTVRIDSGWLRVARGGSEAKAPLLAVHPVDMCVSTPSYENV